MQSSSSLIGNALTIPLNQNPGSKLLAVNQEKKVLRVSGKNNHCGLYALTLGIKFAINQQEAKIIIDESLKQFLNAIPEEALQGAGTDKTEQIGKDLRKHLYHTLISDINFKDACLLAFLELCARNLTHEKMVSTIDDRSVSTSFLRLNKDYIQQLMLEWKNEKKYFDSKWELENIQDEVNQIVVNSKEIDHFKLALQEQVNIINNDNCIEVVNFLFANFYDRSSFAINDIIKLFKLYQLANTALKLNDLNPEKRSLLRSCIDNFIRNKLIACAPASDLYKLPIIMRINFANPQIDSFVLNEEDLKGEKISIFIRKKITSDIWDDIYENYCQYTRDNQDELSADEIGILAKKWKIKLLINGRPYGINHEDLDYYQVTLINPGVKHWNVEVSNISLHQPSKQSAKQISMDLEIIAEINLILCKLLSISLNKPLDNDSLINEIIKLSWRSREISWATKYVYLGFVSEHDWHILGYLSEFFKDNVFDAGSLIIIAEELIKNLTSPIEEVLEHPRKTSKKSEISKENLFKDTTIISSAYNKKQLTEISNTIGILISHQSSLDFNNQFHNKAIFKVIENVGEKSKRLTIEFKNQLPKYVKEFLKITEDLRDLLEKVGYYKQSRVEKSPLLMKTVYNSLCCLREHLNQNMPLDEKDLRPLQIMFESLNETNKYKTEEQLKLLQEILNDKQKEAYESLFSGSSLDTYKKDFLGLGELKNHFKKSITPPSIDLINEVKQYRNNILFKLITDPSDKNLLFSLLDKQNKSKKEQRDYINIVTVDLKKIINIYAELLKQLRSSKFDAEKIVSTVEREKIQIPELNNYLNLSHNQAETLQSNGSSSLSAVRVNEILNKLNEHRNKNSNKNSNNNSDSFTATLADIIAINPELLKLSAEQRRFFQAMRHDKSPIIIDYLTLLNDVKLDEQKVAKILYPSGVSYEIIPFKRKISVKPETNEMQKFLSDMKKVLFDINQLSELVIKATGKPLEYTKVLRIFDAHSLEYMSAQKIFESFGQIAEKYKNKSLTDDPAFENISSRQLFLLVMFRNQIAHRANEIIPEELAWFFIRWVTSSSIELRKIKNKTELTGMIDTFSLNDNFEWSYVTREELEPQIIFIRSLAVSFGYSSRVLAFGKKIKNSDEIECDIGTQAALNLIIQSANEYLPIENLYEMQWQLSLHFNKIVKLISIEQLNKLSDLRKADADKILEQAEDIYQIYLCAKKHRLLTQKKWHKIWQKGAASPISFSGQSFNACQLKNIDAIHFYFDEESIAETKKDRENAIKESEITHIIKRKAEAFTKNLLELIDQTRLSNNWELHKLILFQVRNNISINQRLDRYYENNFQKIQNFNPELTRFSFRIYVRRDLQNIQQIMVDDIDLCRDVRELWNDESHYMLDLQVNLPEDIKYIVGKYVLIFDEIIDFDIINLLVKDTINKADLENLIYKDLIKRYLDPYENAFVEIHFENGFIMIKDAFSSAVNKELITQRSGRLHFLDDRVKYNCIQKIQYLKYNKKETPSNRICTIDNIFGIADHYVYDGKVVLIDSPTLKITYPEPSTLEDFLEKEKITLTNYPGYEEESIEFNDFKMMEQLLDTLADLIKQHIKYISDLETGKINVAEHQKNKSDNLIDISIFFRITRIGELCSLIIDRQHSILSQIINCGYVKKYEIKDLDPNKRKETLLKEIMGYVEKRIAINDKNKTYYHFIKSKLFDLPTSAINSYEIVASSELLYDFDEIPVPLSGNCMFESILIGIEKIKLPSLRIFHSIQEIRLAVKEVLFCNQNIYRERVIQIISEMINTVVIYNREIRGIMPEFYIMLQPIIEQVRSLREMDFQLIKNINNLMERIKELSIPNQIELLSKHKDNLIQLQNQNDKSRLELITNFVLYYGYEAYCNNIAADKTWGHQLELEIIANLLNINIQVFSGTTQQSKEKFLVRCSSGQLTQAGYVYPVNKEAIDGVNIIHVGEEHYNLLVPTTRGKQKIYWLNISQQQLPKVLTLKYPIKDIMHYFSLFSDTRKKYIEASLLQCLINTRI